jgi:hypothetical protein
MMGRLMAFIVVVVCTAQVVLLRAQEPALDLANPRFTFHRTDEGYLRLDLRSGEVATCRPRDSGWTCTLAAEERAALEHEIARLQRDNAALKNALLERGLPLPSGSSDLRAESAPPAGASPRADADVPSAAQSEPSPPRPPGSIPSDPDAPPRQRAEVDRMIDVMERWWHRLTELMAAIQRDIQGKN